ncbi:MAG: hypothetical protein AAF267_18065 [Deinococcota bacterium]
MRASLSFLSHDPVLTYSLIAALFLGLAAIISGLTRLDFIAVFHPHGLLTIVTAVASAVVLMLLAGGLEQLTTNLPWVWVSDLPQTNFPLAGTWRLPLYLVALAYGPSAGLLTAGLFAAFAVSSGTPSWPEALFAFELGVVGWLAIAPSPYTYRWAASFNILLAHLLTTITAGFALLQWQYGEITLSGLQTLWEPTWGGVLLAAYIVSYLSPNVYTRLFAGSRVQPVQVVHTVHMPLPPLLESVPIQVDSVVPTLSQVTSLQTSSAQVSSQPAPGSESHPKLSPATGRAPTSTQATEHPLGASAFLDLDRSSS